MADRRVGWTGGRARLVVLAAGLVLAGCGVEVDASAPSTTTTIIDATITTGSVPPSDDPLVAMLERNGYSREEATCGADELRNELSDHEVDSIVDARDLTDIDPSIAEEFGDIMSDCLDGGG